MEPTPLFVSHFQKLHTTYPISNTPVSLDASDTNTRTQRKDALHYKSAKPAVSRFVRACTKPTKLFETLPNGTLRIPLFRAFLQILTLIVLFFCLTNRNFQLRQAVFEIELYGKNTFAFALQCTTQLIDFPLMKQQQTPPRRFVILRRPELVCIDMTVQPYEMTATIQVHKGLLYDTVPAAQRLYFGTRKNDTRLKGFPDEKIMR